MNDRSLWNGYGTRAPDWQKAEQAPFGPFHAGDMFAAWVAHDLLHTRQLVELHWAWTEGACNPIGCSMLAIGKETGGCL